MKSAKTVALLAAAALLLPGCFVIRGFSFSNWFIPKNGKVIASLKLMPATPDYPRSYAFILIGLPSESSDPPGIVVTGPKRFDTNGNFGGPIKLVKDNVLEQLARDSDTCAVLAGPFLEDTEDSHWMLLRTETRVRSGDKVDKVALTKIGLKPRAPGANGGLVNIYSGLYRDTNDPPGPDAGDAIGCLSSVETNLFIGKPQPTTTSNVPQWVKNVLY